MQHYFTIVNPMTHKQANRTSCFIKVYRCTCTITLLFVVVVLLLLLLLFLFVFCCCFFKYSVVVPNLALYREESVTFNVALSIENHL